MSRYIEIRRAEIGLAGSTVTLLASYQVMATAKAVSASITVTVDTPDATRAVGIRRSSITVAHREFKFGRVSRKFPNVKQEYAEVQAGNWLFEQFQPAMRQETRDESLKEAP